MHIFHRRTRLGSKLQCGLSKLAPTCPPPRPAVASISLPYSPSLGLSFPLLPCDYSGPTCLLLPSRKEYLLLQTHDERSSMGFGFRQTWFPNSGSTFGVNRPVTQTFGASVTHKIGIIILTF